MGEMMMTKRSSAPASGKGEEGLAYSYSYSCHSNSIVQMQIEERGEGGVHHFIQFTRVSPLLSPHYSIFIITPTPSP